MYDNFCGNSYQTVSSEIDFFKVKTKIQKELEEKIKLYRDRGYQFHQNEVKKDPKLLQWVLKKDYFNYKIPSKDLK
jgi:hypothetical protein